MSKTVVSCSHPGCRQVATVRVACPWSYRRFMELKTFGYACPDHVRDVLESARSRNTSYHLAEGEKLGTVTSYNLEAYC